MNGGHAGDQGRRRGRLSAGHVSEQKLKRTGPLTLELAPTEDILAEVVRRRRPGQLIVGFAAETENRMENGRAKLLRKGADAIVVNDVAGEGVGIDADTNAATFLTRPRPSSCRRCPSASSPTASSTRFSRCAGRGRWCGTR
jgi:hypothetical protein